MAATLTDAFIVAIETIADPYNFALLCLAVLLGMFMGMLPGMGGTITLALLIPLTYTFEPTVAILILATALGATNFGGSVSAILINTPGSAPNAATLLDGYPMTRNGEGDRAISASAVASALGAIFGLLIFLLIFPILMRFIVLFGPPEIFWLGVWGLTVIAIVIKGNVTKGLISALLGILFVMHGTNTITATTRWTYGFIELLDGFKLIPALIGLFAIAEMIKLVSEGKSPSLEMENSNNHSGKLQGFRDVYDNKHLFIRSSIVGGVVGLIPGIGGAAANYIAYFQAVQTSKNPEKFGTGDVRGVIASESSNDAKDGTGLLPTLALGIPGSASMAVLLGAFILHGMTPGPLLIEENLEIVTIIIVALFLSNLLTSAIGLLSARQMARVTQIDPQILAPIILIVSFYGTYALDGVVFDIWITLLFGLLGFVMMSIGMSRVPLILAMVLGPIVEENFFRSLQISGGEYSVFFTSAISVLFVILIIASLFLPYIRVYVSRRFNI